MHSTQFRYLSMYIYYLEVKEVIGKTLSSILLGLSCAASNAFAFHIEYLSPYLIVHTKVIAESDEGHIKVEDEAYIVGAGKATFNLKDAAFEIDIWVTRYHCHVSADSEKYLTLGLEDGAAVVRVYDSNDVEVESCLFEKEVDEDFFLQPLIKGRYGS